jgi:hypothetical protein
MSPILRWVRQRAFVILNPCEVAGIKPSAAALLLPFWDRATETRVAPMDFRGECRARKEGI